jgi:hypothetical protein
VPSESVHFLAARFRGNEYYMNKTIHGTQKLRGRPKTTGAGTQIGMRWQDDVLKQIDDWRRAQEDLPSRTDAIRRLVATALKGGGKR